MKHYIVWISVLSLLTIGCESKKTADEYYSAAEIERNAKNIKVSLENLEDLIKKVELSKTNEIVVLKAAEAIGSTPDTKIGFIIINPIA